MWIRERVVRNRNRARGTVIGVMRGTHLLKRAVGSYRRIFHIEEIENSTVLKWMFGALLFFFFLTFNSWIGSNLTTVETAQRGAAVCWPYFQDCWKLYFLHALPYGYSQTTFYMGLYGLMLLIVYFMWKQKWVYAHLLMVVLFLWKVFVGFVLSYLIQGPYDYYHLILTAVLLFFPFKEYFLKLVFVLLYFLSATTKIDPTWVLGTYFTTLKTGLPIFPTFLTPLFTNFVIFMQIVGAWFLLSRTVVLQRLVLIFFVIFHLYSGIFVLYHYPSIALLPLLILFGPLYTYTQPPTSRTSLPSWLFIGAVMLFQIPGFLIPLPGDRRLTLEGNRYGMFMFEANHECVATIRTYRNDIPLPEKETISTSTLSSCSGFYCLTETKQYAEAGLAVDERRFESVSAWNRCDPYPYWARYHAQCARNPGIVRIAFTFDHSINGGPFYRIVDTPNICSLSYAPFSHNDWIKIPPFAPVIGYPLQNVYSY